MNEKEKFKQKILDSYAEGYKKGAQNMLLSLKSHIDQDLYGEMEQVMEVAHKRMKEGE